MAVILVSGIVTLGLIPNTSCACGHYEDGTLLTHQINIVWKSLTGKRFFPPPPDAPK